MTNAYIEYFQFCGTKKKNGSVVHNKTCDKCSWISDFNSKHDPRRVGSIVQNVKADFRVYLNNTSFDKDTWYFAY